jgi:hypothetical protein
MAKGAPRSRRRLMVLVAVGVAAVIYGLGYLTP